MLKQVYCRLYSDEWQPMQIYKRELEELRVFCEAHGMDLLYYISPIVTYSDDCVFVYFKKENTEDMVLFKLKYGNRFNRLMLSPRAF